MVIKIPANIGRAAVDSEKPKTLRVAAYARVSTEFEDQQNSFAAQVMMQRQMMRRIAQPI